MSLHAPSPTPSPGPTNGRSPNFRASMGPTSRPANIATQGMPSGSPRPGGISGAGRPTSELLSGTSMFQTPEGECVDPGYLWSSFNFASVAEAIDQWFENLQNYEATLVSRTVLDPHGHPLTSFAGRYGQSIIGCQLQGRAKRHRAM